MEQDFESILNSLLESYDSNNEKDIDSFITKEVGEMGLSSEGANILKETNELLEKFHKSEMELTLAKKAGEKRVSWIQLKMDSILEGRPEEEKVEVANAILNTREELINQEISEE
jgi:hypothetical protein